MIHRRRREGRGEEEERERKEKEEGDEGTREMGAGKGGFSPLRHHWQESAGGISRLSRLGGKPELKGPGRGPGGVHQADAARKGPHSERPAVSQQSHCGRGWG